MGFKSLTLSQAIDLMQEDQIVEIEYHNTNYENVTSIIGKIRYVSVVLNKIDMFDICGVGELAIEISSIKRYRLYSPGAWSPVLEKK